MPLRILMMWRSKTQRLIWLALSWYGNQMVVCQILGSWGGGGGLNNPAISVYIPRYIYIRKKYLVHHSVCFIGSTDIGSDETYLVTIIKCYCPNCRHHPIQPVITNCLSLGSLPTGPNNLTEVGTLIIFTDIRYLLKIAKGMPLQLHFNI